MKNRSKVISLWKQRYNYNQISQQLNIPLGKVQCAIFLAKARAKLWSFKEYQLLIN